MKRELMMALVGASMLIPADAEAQRDRNRNRDRVGQPAPITAPGRVVPRAPHRVVYTTRPSRRVVYRSFGRHYPGGWARVEWGVRMRPIGYHVRSRVLDQGDLRDVLGNRTVRRLRELGRDLGLRGRLRGHWQNVRGRSRVLVVRMDRVDLAEFVDFDRDGFVDEAFVLHGPRGYRNADIW